MYFFNTKPFLNEILNSHNVLHNLFYYLKLYLICIENDRKLAVNLYANCVTLLDILNKLRKWAPTLC